MIVFFLGVEYDMKIVFDICFFNKSGDKIWIINIVKFNFNIDNMLI